MTMFHNEPKSAGSRTLVDANGLSSLDTTTGAINIIDYAHHEIHGGRGFFAIYSALAADEAVIEVRIQTPNSTRWAHMEIHMEAALAATASLWANTTKTHVSDNALTLLNKNFNSTNVSGLTVCHTPAGSQAGTADLMQYIGSATTSGKGDSGGSTSSRGEFILQQNTAYLLKLTSRAAANALSIILDWYEHTNR